MKVLLVLLVISTIVFGAEIPMMNEEIGEQIFHNIRPYILYVCDEIDDQYLQIFEQYCEDDHECAILNRENEMYEMMTDFVGLDSDHYLLILDAENFHKFVLDFNVSTRASDIVEFYQGFKDGTLQRYYTSQPLPTKNIDPYLRTIVGLNFKDFIDGPELVKVLYLYSQSQGCSTCKQVHEIVTEAAKNINDQSQVAYGALDLFRNDHELLQEVHVPIVLVFSGQEQRVRLEGLEDIGNLQKIIKEKLAVYQEL